MQNRLALKSWKPTWLYLLSVGSWLSTTTPGPCSLTLAVISSLEVLSVLSTGQQAFLVPRNLQEDY